MAAPTESLVDAGRAAKAALVDVERAAKAALAFTSSAKIQTRMCLRVASWVGISTHHDANDFGGC